MVTKNRLSELEQQIMTVIWGRPSSSAADIQKALEPERPLKDSTIRTVLTRLEEKGFVKHTVEGRTFLYSGTERPGKVAARAVKQILDRFCHGSLESLLVGMVDSEIVDADELQRIAARLGQGRRKQLEGKRKDRS
jgi:predicted transcriptional regulator